MADRTSAGGRVRLAAKVILIDRTDRVLLFRGGDPTAPEAGTWWFPPGGGLEPGETAEQAACREVLEETGLRLDRLGPIALHRRAEFMYGGVALVSEEDYFVVRVDHFDISVDGWTDLEREVVVEHRWWPISELRVTDDVVYPDELLLLIDEFG